MTLGKSVLLFDCPKVLITPVDCDLETKLIIKYSSTLGYPSL